MALNVKEIAGKSSGTETSQATRCGMVYKYRLLPDSEEDDITLGVAAVRTGATAAQYKELMEGIPGEYFRTTPRYGFSPLYRAAMLQDTELIQLIISQTPRSVPLLPVNCVDRRYASGTMASPIQLAQSAFAYINNYDHSVILAAVVESLLGVFDDPATSDAVRTQVFDWL